MSATDVSPRASGDQSPEVKHPGRKRRTRLLLAAGAGLAFLTFAVVEGTSYWTEGRFRVSTDDAYVRADNTVVAPKVAGYVHELLVSDNQPVTAGQLLARIDDRDFRDALDQALATEEAAEASVKNIDAQLVAQQSSIKEADAAVRASQASLGLAQRNDVRRQKMAATGYGSTEQADAAASDVKQQAAGLERLQAAALASRQQVGVLRSQRALAQAQLAHASAERRQAELNLSYTNIVAPIDGTVGARSVRAGQYVQAGSQLMAVVPMQQVYARPRRSASTPSPVTTCAAAWTAWRRRAGWSSACSRPTTPPATSPRSSNGYRSRSSSLSGVRSPDGCARECPSAR